MILPATANSIIRKAAPAAIFAVAAFSLSPLRRKSVYSQGSNAGMQFSDMRASLGDAKLAQLTFHDQVIVDETLLSGDEVIGRHSSNANALGSVCFVVRRPGWSLCRAEGQQLTDEYNSVHGTASLLDGFGLFGIVKEVGVDDEGLEEFYSKHFSFPLYLDEERVFYNALGGRKMSFGSLLGLIPKSFGSMGKRLKDKGIDGNFKGEGLVQGGVIVFNNLGEPVYAYQEVTGDELPMKEILDAVQSIRQNSAADTDTTAGSEL